VVVLELIPHPTMAIVVVLVVVVLVDMVGLLVVRGLLDRVITAAKAGFMRTVVVVAVLVLLVVVALAMLMMVLVLLVLRVQLLELQYFVLVVAVAQALTVADLVVLAAVVAVMREWAVRTVL
jgi:hypothetical protein